MYSHLSDDEKLILPIYKKLELLRAIKISDQANILLKLCQHTGFCEECASKLHICPICRSDIQERSIITD
ncbi:unnamed protein product [Adineta steineri]|uniref:RING-type domain-containing protein n=1 Tax=Adineta steineri TaxID=433720 RepID=A0A819KRM0_9BILA|nr:unnamed protein product [Adineta steineri]CAF1455789.1 unnamed protein product [Adineta steineri]CAF3876414.1 unnamed protein product [Adineta steineri]CAF3953153.1 unnamed protein product [Adineta steineri]